MLKKNPVIKEIATWRMQRLFSLASERTKKNGSDSERLAKRYVNIAKEISSHYKVKMPKEIKNAICSNCSNVLVPGLNCRVRLASSKRYVAYVCECGEEKHIFYK